jgi:hypothetical protein
MQNTRKHSSNHANDYNTTGKANKTRDGKCRIRYALCLGNPDDVQWGACRRSFR